jgi:WD40 repeat protein
MATQTVTVKNLTGAVKYMIFNPLIGVNGSLVASVVNYLYFLDPNTLNPMFQAVTTSRTYVAMDFLTPSGNVICGNQFLDVYNTTGSLVFSYSFATTLINRMKLLPDNVTLAIGFTNGSIELFNANTNTLGATVGAHTSCVGWLGLTPDGFFLLSGGFDNSVIVWAWGTMSLTKMNTYSALTTQIYSGVILQSPLTGIYFD